MTWKRFLSALALVLTGTFLLLGCASGPPPPPPPMVMPPPPEPAPPPLYFVNISGLALREGPTTSAPQIASLNFNDEVELLDTSAGWARVRDTRRNIIGWASLKYLQPAPASRPRPTAPKRRPPAEQGPKPSDAPKAM